MFKYLVVLAAVGFILPLEVYAHKSGCHNLHTCPSDTGSYVCGDLGYSCDGSTSVKKIVGTVAVPLTVEKVFMDNFGRRPNDTESGYWKTRFRADKNSVFKLRKAMAWHKANGSTGMPVLSLEKLGSSSLGKRVNAIFRAVYARNPSVSENKYWVSRLQEKTTEKALRGAMEFHKIKNIPH